MELEIPLAGMVDAGDMGMLVKYVAKMTADRHDQTATFMPKPLFGEAGSGMHFHQQLVRNGVNLFAVRARPHPYEVGLYFDV